MSNYDFNGDLDAYHDGLLAKHLAKQDDPWRVVPVDEDFDEGYILVDEDDEPHPDGFVFATVQAALRHLDDSDY